MDYTPEQRERISQEAAGKTVAFLQHDDEAGYWVMTFEDGSEISFRFMAELT